jgi:hypothetical protein
MNTTAAHDRFADALIAPGPFGDDENLRMFDHFIGSWTFDFYDCATGREVLTGRGEWHFSWILGGRAIQDVWEAYSLDQERTMIEQGSTIRVYDAKRRDWAIVFVGPMRGTFDMLRANRIGREIVLQGIGRNGYPWLWVFSDIEENSFTWRSEETRDHGRTWNPLVVMKLSRNHQTASQRASR